MNAQTILPPEPRYKIDDIGDSLRISTGDARLNISGKIVIIFSILFWIGGSIPISIIAFQEIFHREMAFSVNGKQEVFTRPLDLMYATFPIFWLIFGLSLALIFLWQFKFKETILIDNNALIVNYQHIWFTQSKRYLAEHISDLRASPIPPVTILSGMIAFDYGGQTFYFGIRISEAEAKQIVMAIQRKFQRYQGSK